MEEKIYTGGDQEPVQAAGPRTLHYRVRKDLGPEPSSTCDTSHKGLEKLPHLHPPLCRQSCQQWPPVGQDTKAQLLPAHLLSFYRPQTQSTPSILSNLYPLWLYWSLEQVPGNLGDQEVLNSRTVHHGQSSSSPGPALLLCLQPGCLLCYQAVAVPIVREDLCV